MKVQNNERKRKTNKQTKVKLLFVFFYKRSTLTCHKTDAAPTRTQEQQLDLSLHFESSSYIASKRNYYTNMMISSGLASFQTTHSGPLRNLQIKQFIYSCYTEDQTVSLYDNLPLFFVLLCFLIFSFFISFLYHLYLYIFNSFSWIPYVLCIHHFLW